MNAARNELEQLAWEADQLAPRIRDLQQQLRDTRINNRASRGGDQIAVATPGGRHSIARQLTQLLETQNHLLRQIGAVTSQAEQKARELTDLAAQREDLADLQLTARPEGRTTDALLAVSIVAAVVLTGMMSVRVVNSSDAGTPRGTTCMSGDSVEELGLPVVVFAAHSNSAA
jgi:hypothetical protein